MRKDGSLLRGYHRSLMRAWNMARGWIIYAFSQSKEVSKDDADAIARTVTSSLNVNLSFLSMTRGTTCA